MMSVMTPITGNEHDILTSAEVAAIFRVDIKTVSRWDNTGHLKATFRTPGGHRRYRRADVEKIISLTPADTADAE